MKTITGNLLDITAGTIVHQVNVRGATGGLSGVLSRRHPAAFTDYFLLCDKHGIQNAGTVHEGHANRQLSILHVFGQVDPDANTDMALVRSALEWQEARPTLFPIYAPYKMGCGLGGGDWPEYLKALLVVFPDIIIVQRPEDAP